MSLLEYSGGPLTKDNYEVTLQEHSSDYIEKPEYQGHIDEWKSRVEGVAERRPEQDDDARAGKRDIRRGRIVRYVRARESAKESAKESTKKTAGEAVKPLAAGCGLRRGSGQPLSGEGMSGAAESARCVAHTRVMTPGAIQQIRPSGK